MTYILTAEIHGALLKYFAGRPWGEADPAVRALMSLKQSAPESAPLKPAPTIKDAGFAALLACYRSGQIPESTWQEHLADDDFHAWLEQHSS